MMPMQNMPLFDGAQTVSDETVHRYSVKRQNDDTGAGSKKAGKYTGANQQPLSATTEARNAYQRNDTVGQESEVATPPATSAQSVNESAPQWGHAAKSGAKPDEVLKRPVRQHSATLCQPEAPTMPMTYKPLPQNGRFPSIITENDEEIRKVSIDQYEYTLFFSTPQRAYVIRCSDPHNKAMWLEFGPFTLEAGSTFIDGRIERSEAMRRG